MRRLVDFSRMISTGGGVRGGVAGRSGCSCCGVTLFRKAAVSRKLEVEERYLIVRMFCLLCSRAIALLLLGGIDSTGDTTMVGLVMTARGIVIASVEQHSWQFEVM